MEHAEKLVAHDMQASSFLASPSSTQHWLALEQQGMCFSAYKNDTLLCFAGLMHQWEGRAIGWMLASKGLISRDALWMHRSVLDFLNRHQTADGYRRVETWCYEDEPVSIRWVQMLGFKKEGTLSSYTPEGRNAVMMARIRR